MNKPLVSVVITTKNEETNIARCINSIKKQSYENIEIIVVDNASIDNTKSISKSFGAKVYDKGPERSAQRNYGAQVSNGKYFMYLDADMALSTDVIKECVEIMRKKDISALYIPEIIVGNSFWIKVRRFERSFYDATIIDCVRFFDRKNFLSLGGFDFNLTGPEDWDMDRRIRSSGSVAIIKNPLYHDEGEFNLQFYLNKKKYYSGSMDQYIEKWGKNDIEIRKQLGMYYRLFGVFIEKGRWMRLMKSPILTLGMYWLRFLVGFNYLRRGGSQHDKKNIY